MAFLIDRKKFQSPDKPRVHRGVSGSKNPHLRVARSGAQQFGGVAQSVDYGVDRLSNRTKKAISAKMERGK